ncbi:MAG: triose-phosphate isomerase [Acidimicrobiia bacterium]
METGEASLGTDRKIWIGTSWKMNKTIGEAIEYVDHVLPFLPLEGVQPFVVPAHTSLAAVRARVPRDSQLLIGAQNAHWASEGAGTGEISMRMVHDAGAEFVEIGHSERRMMHGETDETVALKVRAAVDEGLFPLVCVGEPSSVRTRGNEIDFVIAQAHAAVALVDSYEVGRVVFAYEPVWAIGSSGREASADEVRPVIDALRVELGTTRAILFGGSVNTGNVLSLLEDPETDGVFVGRAAWSAAGYATILELGSSVALSRGYL